MHPCTCSRTGHEERANYAWNFRNHSPGRCQRPCSPRWAHACPGSPPCGARVGNPVAAMAIQEPGPQKVSEDLYRRTADSLRRCPPHSGRLRLESSDTFSGGALRGSLFHRVGWGWKVTPSSRRRWHASTKRSVQMRVVEKSSSRNTSR